MSVRQETEPALRLDAHASDTIKAARFICIFFMCFVHVYGLAYISGPVLQVSQDIVINLLGRASVPLLSAVSGYLAVLTLTGTPLLRIADKKFKSLVIPMAVWNVLAILLGIAVAVTTGAHISFYEEIQNKSIVEILIGNIFAINYEGAQNSHNFLRDVFVCYILFPLIHRLTRINGMATIGIVATIIYTVGTEPIIYRAQILLFFTFGVVAASNNIQFKLIVKFWKITLPFFLVIGIAQISPNLMEVLEDKVFDYDLFKRIIVSHMMLCVCYFIIARMPRYLLNALNDITFIAFLSHNIFFALVWAPFLNLIEGGWTEIYFVYFFSAPVLLWFAAYAEKLLASRSPIFIQRLLFGRKY